MIDNQLITKDHGRVIAFFKSIDRMLDGLENLAKNHRPTLGGERYLTDREVSEHLKVSRRALQDYRNGGRLPYYKLGGKNLYRESDIPKMLDTNYREAFK